MSVYRVEGSKIRHLEVTCDALRAEVIALHPEIEGNIGATDAACEMQRRSNTQKLRDATHRCTAGCWKEYARQERASAITGDRAHGKDQSWNAASIDAHASARDRATFRRALKKLSPEDAAKITAAIESGSARVTRASS